MAAICLLLLERMQLAGVNILAVSVEIFVAAWSGRFSGHNRSQASVVF